MDGAHTLDSEFELGLVGLIAITPVIGLRLLQLVVALPSVPDVG